MKEKSDAGILEEVAHLETMRLTVLNRTDFGRQLVITGLTPEFATSRDRHFHELLELRFLFAMLDAEKSILKRCAPFASPRPGWFIMRCCRGNTSPT